MIKKLKLFPKIFIVTFVTVIVTIMFFFFIFKFFIGSFIETFHSERFNSSLALIEELIDKKEIDEEKIREINKDKRIDIIVNKNNAPFYPSIEENSLMPLNVNFKEEQEDNRKKSNNIIVSFREYNNSLIKEYNFKIDNDNYQLFAIYLVQVNENDMANIFSKILPYIVIMGFFVALLISYIYAKYNTRKIKKFNKIMNEMENQEYILLNKPIVGDELTELENNIDHLYKKLIEEMEIIKKFEKDREVFMRGTVHELKTPIMTMSLQLEELLQSDLDDDTEIKIIELQNRIYSMTKLVNEILNISKLESILNSSNIDCKIVILELLKIYEYVIEDKNISIDLNVESGNVQINEGELKKLISNLISNAVKYSPENETINISFINGEFIIKNKYIGIIDESKNFCHPFVVNTRDEESHGLGLYIVATILNKYKLDYKYKIYNNSFVFLINFKKKL